MLYLLHQSQQLLCLVLIISFFIINETMAKTQEAHETKAKEKTVQESWKKDPSALLKFGDSLLDNWNNNYINSLVMKSSFRPYGIDFPNHVPTGRFTIGDIIARYVEIKDFLPPYLDPSLGIEELMTGVTFASSGSTSGFDPFTSSVTNVIPMSKQLEHFKEYQKKLEGAIGKEKTTCLIEKALYIVGAAANDFNQKYFVLPFRPSAYSVSSYTDFLLQNIQQFMQALIELGARRIGVMGIPPLGCMPFAITAHSKSMRNCIHYINTAASKYYNARLQLLLKQMQLRFSDSQAKFLYLDLYGPLSDIITSSNNYSMCPHLLF